MPTCLVLGATSDIGYAIAKKFAAQGFDIQLAARQPQQLLSFKSDIEIRFQTSCSLHAFDALDFASHEAFYAGLSPLPDVAVCVVGYMTENENAQQNWLQTHTTIDSNYTGPVSVFNLLAPGFAARGSGTLVGISSVAGIRGRQSNYIYGSAKAGFSAYLSGLRNFLAKKGVHVLTVLPGFVYTKMTEHLQLPPLLTAQPSAVADVVYHGVMKKLNIVYVKWFWRWIMLIITSIPESIFKKLKL